MTRRDGPNPFHVPAPNDISKICRVNTWSDRPHAWLRPCESPLDHAHREGRRIRPGMAPSGRSLSLPQLDDRDAPVMLTAGASGSFPRRRVAAKIGGPPAKVKPTHDGLIWPAGGAGGVWRPPTVDEQEYRNAVVSAVRAANAVRSKRSSQPKRRAPVLGTGPREVESDVTPWDSVSQTSSPKASPRGRIVPPGGHGSDVLSCETMTQTSMGQLGKNGSERVIQEHLKRQKAGWYDHIYGRMIG